MKYEIKQLNDTDAIVISDEEIKISDPITDGYKIWYWRDNCSLLGRKKIIATISPFKIEGLPMLELPNQEEDVKKLAENYTNYICDKEERLLGLEWNQREIVEDRTKDDFIEGYKAAQKQYSEEDMINAIKFFKAYQITTSREIFEKDINIYLQSLQKTQFPIAVDLEIEQENLGEVFNGRNSSIMWGDIKLKVIKWYYE